ncbi:serine protease Hayan-like [Contarinia nasturtii]|uniref:serine protease Hayan-like n=1 Tax=Contarinia nasturtii TaxID=265458 RepID=UPI0012D46B19|nr:serine protease Hayan-like [Contarinia nasturtii]XP_031632042.1 serine protease Hayan-like [Contarinia nasturtii]XP_031632043.1 serine protease Hayan-like [Contarinia nasturtii]
MMKSLIVFILCFGAVLINCATVQNESSAPPTISIVIPFSFKIGETVRLPCNAYHHTKNTSIAVVWHKLDGSLPDRANQSDGVLTINDVQLVDSGVYVCQTQSEPHYEQRVAITVEASSEMIRNEATGSLDDRIFLGDKVEGEFPWMVALAYVDGDRISFKCGGTIISEFYVLTAAHCATEQDQPIFARLGKLKLRDKDTSGDTHYIMSITRHPNYSSLTKKHDIALIRLRTKIILNNVIKAATLHNDTADIASDINLTVAGWGITDFRNISSQSNDLLKIEIFTTPLNECNTTYLNHNSTKGSREFQYGLSPGQYCAMSPNGTKDGYKDSCDGDSGGPLLLISNNVTKEATLVGIVSFGYGCGLPLPSIYTRVAHYIDWITPIVWPNGTSGACEKKWQCDNGKYIDAEFLCASAPACGKDEWQCDNGKCINAEFKCDGLLDCIDYSDETKKNCPLENIKKCKESEIECDNKCYPSSILCNGAPECQNGFDETNCPTDIDNIINTE